MSLAAEFAARCRYAVGALKTDLPVVDVFPVLRELEPIREVAFGPRDCPGILIEPRPAGGWRIETSIPDVGDAREGVLPDVMSEAESADIRSHLIKVVGSWLSWAHSQQEITDPSGMVVESLRWFIDQTGVELVKRAARLGRLELLPLFKTGDSRDEGWVIDFRHPIMRPKSIQAMMLKPSLHRPLADGVVENIQVKPYRTAVDDRVESIKVRLERAVGPEVARCWIDFSRGIKDWRAEVDEHRFRWERDHGELSPAADLRVVFSDGLIEQAERLRTDAGGLVRLIERARGAAESKPAGADLAGGVYVPGDGLFPDERCLIWGGCRFDRLTEKMVKILAVFDEQFKAGFPVVNLLMIESKTKIRFDGAFINQAFKQNRKGEPSIHPVAAVIETVGRGEYRLKEPLKIKI